MQKLPKDFQLFIIAVVFGASALLIVLSPQIPWEAWPELLLFVLMVAVLAMFPIPDPRGGAINATPPLFYVLFSVHGPAAAILVALSAYVVGSAISRGWIPWRTLWNGSQFGISAAFGGLVFKALGGSASKLGFATFLLPFTLAALTYQLTNNLFVAVFFSRLLRRPLLSRWLSDLSDVLWSNLVGLPSAALLAILYVSISPLALLVYLVSLLLQRLALKLYFERKRIYAQAIDSLVVAIDSNFPEGKGHSKRVAETATAIAKQLNLSDAELEIIEMGALLHDVGMIGLVDVHESAPSVSDLRSDRMREHVILGADIARSLSGRGREIAEIILHHHENHDGSGYPEGLKGAQITLGASVVGLAEAYESMSASIAQGIGLTASETVENLKSQAGKHFDPRVFEAFVAAFEQGAITTSADTIKVPAGRRVQGSSVAGQ